MFDISTLKKVKGIRLETANTNSISGQDVKRIRKDIFHMSQTAFALALGVSKKTIEAWECGRNTPIGTAQKLLYLLENNTNLMSQLYNVVDERKEITPVKYAFEEIGKINSNPSFTKSNIFYGIKEDKNGTSKLFA